MNSEEDAMCGAPFGPFCDGMPALERAAQLRSLASLAAVRGVDRELIGLLRKAETDGPAARAAALAGFDRLPALTRRHILAIFSVVHRPQR